MHKAQGATVERASVLATPGMDRHLAYVAMTRHREQAGIYAAYEDFKDFEALKQRLSRERLKDTTLDYAEHRGLEMSHGSSECDEASVSEPDPITRFRKAQREFILTAGRADLDPVAKARAVELRAEMKSAAEDIAKESGTFPRGRERRHRRPGARLHPPHRTRKRDGQSEESRRETGSKDETRRVEACLTSYTCHVAFLKMKPRPRVHAANIS